MSNQIYKFDNFHINPNQRKLFYQDNPVQMSTRAFDMLLMLVEKQGEVIEKEEFLQKVWSDSFVEESNLVVHISALRRALQEKRGERKFIETVSGRGYCFVAPITKITANPQKTVLEETFRIEGKSAIDAVSIAVMPFKDNSGNPDLEYLANGITQSLIDNLAQIPGLKVMAYSAVIGYKNSDADLQEIGFLLGVDKLLLGYITEYKDNLEINIELVNAEDKQHIWGTQYEFKLNDYFQIRKELSLTVAEKLQLQLTKLDKINLARQSTSDSDAHKLYLKGKHILENFASSSDRRESLNSALRFFQQALKKDPNYAAAYAGIGNVYFFLFNNGFLTKAEVYDKCKKSLNLALKFDENLSEAYVLKGIIEMFFDQNLSAANHSLSTAIKLNPNNAYAYHMQSLQLMFTQNPQESIAYQNLAIQLDPASTSFNCGLINRFFFTKDFDKAIIQAEETLELNSNSSPAYLVLALTYAQLGIYDEALKNIEKSIKIHHSQESSLICAYINALAGNSAKAKEILNNIIAETKGKHNLTGIAAVYAALGDEEKCLEYLEKEFAEIEDVIVFLIRIDPRFSHLQNNPKFQSLLQKLETL